MYYVVIQHLRKREKISQMDKIQLYLILMLLIEGTGRVLCRGQLKYCQYWSLSEWGIEMFIWLPIMGRVFGWW